MASQAQRQRTRAQSQGQAANQGRRTKGRVGSVRIKRGPRKGKVVKAYIYANGSWSEIKGGGRAGKRHAAGTGKTRIKPKYSAASLRARARRKALGVTFKGTHKQNVRLNRRLKRTHPRAAIPHTLKRSPSRHRGGAFSDPFAGVRKRKPHKRKRSTTARSAGQAAGRALQRPPSKHRGTKRVHRRRRSFSTTTRKPKR